MTCLGSSVQNFHHENNAPVTTEAEKILRTKGELITLSVVFKPLDSEGCFSGIRDGARLINGWYSTQHHSSLMVQHWSQAWIRRGPKISHWPCPRSSLGVTAAGHAPTVSASSPGLADDHRGEAWLASALPSAIQSVDHGLHFPRIRVVSPQNSNLIKLCNFGVVSTNCKLCLFFLGLWAPPPFFFLNICLIFICPADCIVKFGKVNSLVLHVYMVN